MPCIRGLRIPVATVVGVVAEGMTKAEILEAYPNLAAEDIQEALRYAAEALQERALPIEPVRFRPEQFCDEHPLAWEIKTRGVKLQ